MPIEKYIKKASGLVKGQREKRRKDKEFEKELKQAAKQEEERTYRKERKRLNIKTAKAEGKKRAEGKRKGTNVIGSLLGVEDKKTKDKPRFRTKTDYVVKKGKIVKVKKKVRVKAGKTTRGETRSSMNWDSFITSPRSNNQEDLFSLGGSKKKKKGFLDSL